MEEENQYSSDSYFANVDADNSPLPLTVKALRLYFQSIGGIFPAVAAKQALDLFFTPRKSKVQEFKKKILNMGTAISFPHNNEELLGYKWGTGNKNILLVHGWEGNSASLGGFVPGLVKSGYSVYAFDGPAHGAHKAVKTNMIDFGKAIIDIMDQLKTVDTIIAHSFGGSSAVYTLAKHENRKAISNLIIVASPTRINNVINRFAKYLTLSKEIEELMIERIMKKTNAEFEDFDLANYANKADINRVLILHDKKDDVVPIADAYHLLKNWPKAQLKTFNNLGHNEILWNEDAHTEVLNFLDNKE